MMENETSSQSPSVTHKTYLIVKDTIESTIRKIDFGKFDNITQAEIQEIQLFFLFFSIFVLIYYIE